jgi:hypothetical protein
VGLLVLARDGTAEGLGGGHAAAEVERDERDREP